MRSITLHLHAPLVGPADAFARIADFERYPELTDTVQEVVVTGQEADGTVLSEWLVRFRNGLLRWTEQDTIDHESRTISFVQTTGDFDDFRGTWEVRPDEGSGTLAIFDATFDLGMASLEAILDPIAEAALRSNITLIAEGLLGEVSAVELDPR